MQEVCKARSGYGSGSSAERRDGERFLGADLTAANSRAEDEASGERVDGHY